MNKKRIGKLRIVFAETIIVLLLVLVFLILYKGSWSEILGVVIGILVSQVITNAMVIFKLLKEDDNKMAKDNFSYHPSYILPVRFGNNTVDLWYEPSVNSYTCEYSVVDTNAINYKLPAFIQTHYISLIRAHQASLKENFTMIRLDDFDYDKEHNKATVYTSRTTFFNDLVTNRAIDFKIDDEVSVRDIYESGTYLTPLKDSAFSNHIGLNAMVFVGDKLLMTRRGSTATMSKNILTSAVAIGYFQKDVDCEEFITPADMKYSILEGIIKNKTAELLNFSKETANELLRTNKMKIHFLGFGRLIYMGGKPQFYYAVSIEEGAVKVDDSGFKNHEIIDLNEGLLSVTKLELAEDGDFLLKLTTEDGKIIKRNAEKSFFANYYHLVSQPRLFDIPNWIYDGALLKKEEENVLIHN